MGVKMNFSRVTLISYCGLITLVMRPVTSCSQTTRQREEVALKACLAHWSVTPSTYVIDLQSTLFDANLTHVCRVDKIEEADHCVTTVPVDNCLEVLLFWRHFIDPVNQACSNIKDFTSSMKCVDQTRLKTCQDKTSALDVYSRRKSVRRQHCQTILEYKACMDGVVQDAPDCQGNSVGTLNNVIGLHLLHLGGYYKCSQDYPFVMQPVDSLKGSAFQNASSLRYQNEGDERQHHILCRENVFVEPEGGWQVPGRIYLVVNHIAGIPKESSEKELDFFD